MLRKHTATGLAYYEPDPAVLQLIHTGTNQSDLLVWTADPDTRPFHLTLR